MNDIFLLFPIKTNESNMKAFSPFIAYLLLAIQKKNYGTLRLSQLIHV